MDNIFEKIFDAEPHLDRVNHIITIILKYYDENMNFVALGPSNTT